jgi:predicted Rossmann-fold nucleotide-binding protein
MERLAIYCGSTAPAPEYLELARNVGRTLARRGIGVVYGGGRLGLMGAIADAALAEGGEVIGVIPEALVRAEMAHTGLDHLEIVQTMHERKARFTELADGFVVGLLNHKGFWDPMIQMWERMGEIGFVRPQHRDLLIAAPTLDELLARLADAQPTRPIIQLERDEL